MNTQTTNSRSDPNVSTSSSGARGSGSSSTLNSATVSSLRPRETAIAEHRRCFNFQPSTARNSLPNLRGNARKKHKTSDKPLWNHIFVCLSSTNWKHMPTFAEKAELALSGIGEKKISSPSPTKHLRKHCTVSFRVNTNLK